jgi:hypothetical protein
MSESTVVREIVIDESLLPSTPVTPYKATKAANAVLETYGLKRIPPQYLNGLTTARIRDGKDPKIGGGFAVSDTEPPQYLVSPEGLAEWLVGYLERKGVNVTPEPQTDPRDEVDDAYLTDVEN